MPCNSWLWVHELQLKSRWPGAFTAAGQSKISCYVACEGVFSSCICDSALLSYYVFALIKWILVSCLLICKSIIYRLCLHHFRKYTKPCSQMSIIVNRKFLLLLNQNRSFVIFWPELRNLHFLFNLILISQRTVKIVVLWYLHGHG